MKGAWQGICDRISPLDIGVYAPNLQGCAPIERDDVDRYLPKPEEWNCSAVRQAVRHVAQFYDQFLTPVGLRTTQFSILAKLQRLGPLTINALAAAPL